VTKIGLVNGDSIDLEKTKPRLLIIDCFYATCFPCRKSVPALNRIDEKYRDKGVQLIGIDETDQDRSRVLTFIENLKVNYPISHQFASTQQFQVTSYPTLLIFDENLHFIKGLVGYHDQLEQELETLIENELKL
jgi:thiol-disulfide isomerase/thioredoxin